MAAVAVDLQRGEEEGNVSVVYFLKLNIVFMMLDVDGTPPELPSSS